MDGLHVSISLQNGDATCLSTLDPKNFQHELQGVTNAKFLSESLQIRKNDFVQPNELIEEST